MGPFWRVAATALTIAMATAAPLGTEFQEGFGVQVIDIRVGCVASRWGECTGHSCASWQYNVSYVVVQKDAQFLVFHFARLRLPAGAQLWLRGMDHESLALYVEGDSASGFFTRPIYSQRVVVDYSVPVDVEDIEAVCYGFHIDQYRFAAQSVERWATPAQPIYTRRYHAFNGTVQKDRIGDLGGQPRTATSSDQCVGSVDYSVPAACTRFSPDMFEKSKAVARLLVHKANGSVFCTGWLLGCEGHVMTNNHCVGSSAEANSTTIEFVAQGVDCEQDCDFPMACPGLVEATSSEIVASSPTDDLDFALLLPRLEDQQRRDLTAKYGFLAMRSQGPMLNERIFIPQHPAGFGKRVAVKYDSTYGSVVTLNASGCNPLQSNTGYLLNTKGGSSGSPVIADQDKSVVGLHYCGGCLNSAIPSNLILAALDGAAKMPQCARN